MRIIWLVPFFFILLACNGSTNPTAPRQPDGPVDPPPPPPLPKIQGVFRPVASATTAPVKVQAKASAVDGVQAASVSTPTMTSPRKFHSGVKLLDGKLLIFGGATDVNGIEQLATAEVFDPETESFSAVGSMGVPRLLPASARLDDGRVVVVGGVGSVDNGDPGVDVYDPATQSWSQVVIPGLPQDNWNFMAGKLFTLPAGKLLYYGGNAQARNYSDPVVIDTTTEPWSITTISTEPLHHRVNFASIVLADGRILISGGMAGGIAGAEDESWKTLDEIIIFNPADNSLALEGHMTTARQNHSALQYADGRVQFYGGNLLQTDPQPLIRLDSVETYTLGDPLGLTAGKLLQVRSMMESNLLQNGISLHGGGPNDQGLPTNIQLTYNYDTNESAITNQMVKPRIYFLSLVMNNGRVLYCGGSVDDWGLVDDTAEVFDSYSLVMINTPTDAIDLGGTLQCNLVSGGPVIWTCDIGTIDENGLYTAPVANTKDPALNPRKAFITATSSTDDTIKAVVEIKLLEPNRLQDVVNICGSVLYP